MNMVTVIFWLVKIQGSLKEVKKSIHRSESNGSEYLQRIRSATNNWSADYFYMGKGAVNPRN